MNSYIFLYIIFIFKFSYISKYVCYFCLYSLDRCDEHLWTYSFELFWNFWKGAYDFSHSPSPPVKCMLVQNPIYSMFQTKLHLTFCYIFSYDKRPCHVEKWSFYMLLTVIQTYLILKCKAWKQNQPVFKYLKYFRHLHIGC